jgi:hypothetical protein
MIAFIRPMEAKMTMFDEQARRSARQELLETFSSGMSSQYGMSTSGTVMEMLEIAAAERRRSRELGNGPRNDGLTLRKNDRRMAARLLSKAEAVLDVANKFATNLRAWRLPARPFARAAAE